MKALETSDLQKFRKASRKLRLIATAEKNKLLQILQTELRANSKQLLEENQRDQLEYQKDPEFSQVMLDRLVLNESRIAAMLASLNEVEKKPDPVGQIVSTKEIQPGLQLKQIRDSFGVILFIFESRPNVILEAFSLAFKSGNVMILKNGKECKNSAKYLYDLIKKSLRLAGLSEDFICGLHEASREEMYWLMQQDRWIDLLIPRGGEKLIETVKENSRIPVIQNDRGLCHLYVDEASDLDMALQILLNGKTQRPSVCNALETLLVHEKVAEVFLPRAQKALASFQMEWWVSENALPYLQAGPLVHSAGPDSFDTEYLSFKISCRVVKNLNEAIEHINDHGSKHSEVIVTQNQQSARQFQNEVDAAVTYWNASSRFTDGFEFGLGGEIGISTQKLHVRGPVGLESLTSLRWMVDGTGQIRK